jgi:hypothetical protein
MELHKQSTSRDYAAHTDEFFFLFFLIFICWCVECAKALYWNRYLRLSDDSPHHHHHSHHKKKDTAHTSGSRKTKSWDE